MKCLNKKFFLKVLFFLILNVNFFDVYALQDSQLKQDTTNNQETYAEKECKNIFGYGDGFMGQNKSIQKSVFSTNNPYWKIDENGIKSFYDAENNLIMYNAKKIIDVSHHNNSGKK